MKEDNCCNKKTKRGANEKKLIINRLNRISGQISGINKMIFKESFDKKFMDIEDTENTYINEYIENGMKEFEKQNNVNII